jgi:hypothetical protein
MLKRIKLGTSQADQVILVIFLYVSLVLILFYFKGKEQTWEAGALSSIKGAARLINDASPTPTNLNRIMKA